jgi:hypothetical protein
MTIEIIDKISHAKGMLYGLKELPVLVTVYFPHITRYFKGGRVYEDKIFKGS